MAHASEHPEPSLARHRRRRKVTIIVAAILCGYVAVAYLVVPFLWESYVRRHPALEDVPGITQTSAGIPGDPINVALIGTKQQVVDLLQAAQWHAADPLSLRSDVEIAADTVFDRPYDAAPVSSLFLYGRKEDLAFEKLDGRSPDHRNHVRFWKSDKADPEGRPMWLGAATYDKGVGVSHRTGQITHHIAADVDAERDRLFKDLQDTGGLSEIYVEPGFHKVLQGKNGGGDPWETDGDLKVGVIAAQR